MLVAQDKGMGIIPSVMSPRQPLLLVFLAGMLVLAGCGGRQTVAASSTPSPSPAPPTATPEPLAARVNGEPIRLADFEAEVVRFESGQVELGIDLATLGDYRGQVLQALIERMLLAQAARAGGASADEEAVTSRIEQLVTDLGSSEALDAWMVNSGYSMEAFRAALAEELLAAQTVAQIAEGVPASVEQVRARHILLATREEAESVRQRLGSGADFAELAQALSLDQSTRPAGGDLGWFPRGYLTVPEVEEAAFGLQPGEIGEVVESALGFHLVQVTERGVHALTPDAWQRLREQAVQDWLTSERERATIEIFVSP